jgi:hypothetical protein
MPVTVTPFAPHLGPGVAIVIKETDDSSDVDAHAPERAEGVSIRQAIQHLLQAKDPFCEAPDRVPGHSGTVPAGPVMDDASRRRRRVDGRGEGKGGGHGEGT